MDATAFDIAMANHDPVGFEVAAREVGFLGFGFYPRSGFIKVDLGPARQWRDRTCSQDTACARGAGREPYHEGRQCGACGDTGCRRGVEVAQSALAETQSAILPLVPYRDALHGVFNDVALGGTAVTIQALLGDQKRTAMVVTLPGGIGASPWTRAALRNGGRGA